MKSPLLATGLIGLAMVGLWYFGGGTQSLPTARAEESSYVATPLMHENLTVYFVCGPDAVPDAKVLSLQEALEREMAVVNETSNVNALTVENRSPDSELFIQSGDIVKGGKQDRVAAIDMLLPPASGVVTLPVNCVEHGRWTARGNENSQQFNSSNNFIAGKDVKYANATFQQPVVWEKVKQEQSKLNANVGTSVNAPASPSSFQLSLESPAIKSKVAKYEAALKAAGESRSDIIGVVFVVNGQVTGAEVYGSNALFRKAWPKLLTASAIEAVAERNDKSVVMPPSASEVELFLARAAEPEPVNRSEVDQRTATQIRNRIGNLGRAVMNDEETIQPGVVSVTYPVTNSRNEPDRPGRIIIEGNTVIGDRMVDWRPGQIVAPANPTTNRPVAQAANPGAPQQRIAVPALGPLSMALDFDVPVQRAPGNRQQLFHFSTGVFGADGNTAGQQPPAQSQSVQPAPNPPGAQPVGQPVGGSMTLSRPSLPSGRAVLPPNANVNQLSSNRTENRSTLVVESRDAKRQNAVIHRSYIKK